MRISGLGPLLLASTLVCTPAEAALIDLGNGLIYDTIQDVTWAQDAMLARTLGYDADGMMEWTEALAFAANLEYGGYDDWRLPHRFGGYFLLENSSEIARLLDGLGWVIDPCCGVEYRVVGGSGPFVNFQNPWIDRYWLGQGDRYWHEILVTDLGDPGGAWVVRDGGNPAARVPEPSTLLLMGLGALGARYASRKRSSVLGN